jgi:chromosome segregation ATPase
VNEKLISDLETEEKRLKNNESKFKEKIQTLVTELSIKEDMHLKYTQLSKTYSDLQHSYNTILNELKKGKEDSVTLHNKLRESHRAKEEAELKIKELFIQAGSLSVELKSISKEKEGYGVELTVISKQLQDVTGKLSEFQEKYTQLDSNKKQMDIDHAKQSLKHMMEREKYKNKFNEMKHSNSEIQEKLEKTKIELSNFQSAHFSRELELKSQWNISQTINHSQMEESIKMRTSQLIENHRVEMNAVESKMNSLRQAYSALEVEFIQARRAEDTKTSQLEAYSASLKDQINTQSESFKKLKCENEEQAFLLSDMIKLVKNQKSNILQLQTNISRSIKECSKNEQLIEESRIQETKYHVLINDHNATLSGFKNDLNISLNIRKELESKLLTFQDSFDSLSTQFQTQNHLLEQKSSHIINLKIEHEQIILVKNKMLEDQNGTIRNIKTTLESKVGAHHITLKELEQCKIDIEENNFIDQKTLDQFRNDVNISFTL